MKKALSHVWSFLVWLCPFAVFLAATLILIKFVKGTFEEYTKLVDVVVWPMTVLIGLFFFRKVVTYLFFSMNEFNFFGAKGRLRNVDDLIREKADDLFLEEKRDQDRLRAEEKMTAKIKEKEDQLNALSGEAAQFKTSALEILKDWKKSSEEYKNIINDLDTENKKLKDRLTTFDKISSVNESASQSGGGPIGSGEVMPAL